MTEELKSGAYRSELISGMNKYQQILRQMKSIGINPLTPVVTSVKVQLKQHPPIKK